MKNDRILAGNIRKFFEEDSPVRDVIANYVRENLCKGARSVALCFRGNFATLYYRCHQLLRICNSRKGLIGEFDFRHARFTKGYKQILERLKELDVDISGFSDEPGKDSHRYVRFPLIGFGENRLEKVLSIYKELIDDFVDPDRHDYAFDPKTSRKKSQNLEKDRQQQLYAAYFLHCDMMYYDLEYAEPRGKEKDGLHGRFDLLGLRKTADGYTLLLTELKSSPQAIRGKSGVTEHERDYLRYLDSPCLELRKEEACQTVRLFCKIFGKPYPEDLTPENIQNAKIQFVFSDKVIDVGKSYCPTDGRIEKVYLENGKLL